MNIHQSPITWVMTDVPIFHITQPWMVYGLFYGYFFRWCPIYPKWDIYQSLIMDHSGFLHLSARTAINYGNQTWLAGKSPMKMEALLGKSFNSMVDFPANHVWFFIWHMGVLNKSLMIFTRWYIWYSSIHGLSWMLWQSLSWILLQGDYVN